MYEPTIIPSLDQLKALTHPARTRMLGILRVDGPSTATMLAARLGINSGATSYHLRHLAQHGFIVDDPERGNGRERWWKAAHQMTRTDSDTLPDNEEARETFDAYLQVVVTNYAERLQRSIEERAMLPDEWRDTTTYSDWIPRLTPAKATEVRDHIMDMLNELEDDPEGEPFSFQLNAFPEPGHLGRDPEAD
ncbi:MAG: ArsR/SmtB family transcription factor [Nocardioides sp.]|uniref:ArsR/SmtB family transcription factor n=1 Tax=Nocardioides sp. TaxID=35761 RepID=UPI003D6A7BC5